MSYACPIGERGSERARAIATGSACTSKLKERRCVISTEVNEGEGAERSIHETGTRYKI